MFRLFVILIPLLVAVGCTMIALKLPPKGSDQDRAVRLLAGAFAIGVFFSVITWWQQVRVGDQVAENREAVAGQASVKAWDSAAAKGYEDKINTLTAQVDGLRAQLAKRTESPQPAITAAVQQQTSGVPKIYWTQEDAGAGAAAVRFKIYGPLNVPAFVAICDRPCRATSGQIGPGSEGIQVVGATNKIAGYVFRKPRPTKAGAEGFVIVEPGSAKVTEFRVLGESEIPENLR